MGKNTSLRAADGMDISAYLAEPAREPRGAIVVLPEVFGVNSHIRAVTDGFASAGYLGVALATFHRVAPGLELGYSPQDVDRGIVTMQKVEALPAPGVLRDIQAAIDWAAQRSRRIGVVGFCWGGLLSWRSACTLNGLSAAVTYYGGGMTVGEEMDRDTDVPVLAHFGRRDTLIPTETVAAFARTHREVEVHLYDADHGFNCDQRASFGPDARALAAKRTLDFFARHVG